MIRDTRTYIYFAIYIEIIISVYHTSFKRKRVNRIFSQGSQVSIGWNHALGLAAYVLEQRQRQRAVRSAQKYSTRASPRAERATRIAFAVGYRPSRSLIAREFGFTARSFSATFISSVLRLLVRVARPSTPCTVHRRLMIPSEWEIDH